MGDRILSTISCGLFLLSFIFLNRDANILARNKMLSKPGTTQPVTCCPQTTQAVTCCPQTTQAVTCCPQTTQAVTCCPQTTQAVTCCPQTTQAVTCCPQMPTQFSNLDRNRRGAVALFPLLGETVRRDGAVKVLRLRRLQENSQSVQGIGSHLGHWDTEHRHQNNWRFTVPWEAGWRYGIISLWTAKNIQTNNLISENILSSHQFNRPPVSSVNCFDVYALT